MKVFVAIRLKIAVFVASLSLVGSAAAAPRVVLDVPKGSVGQAILDAMVQAQVDVVPASAFFAAGKAAKVKKKQRYSQKGLRKVLKKLSAEGLIRITIKGKGKNAAAALDIYNAQGSKVSSAKADLAKGKLSESAAGRVASHAKSVLPGLSSQPQEPSPAVATAPTEPQALPEAPAQVAAPSTPLFADEAPSSSDAPSPFMAATRGYGSSMPVVSTAATPPRSTSDNGIPTLTILALGGSGTRSYLRQGPSASAGGKFRYATDVPYPEAGFELNLFPLRKQGRALAGLGIELSGMRGFLRSSIADDTGATRTFDTPITRFQAALRYQVALWESETASRIGVRAGFGGSQFTPNTSSNNFFDVSRTGVQLGLDFVQPLVGNYLRFELGGNYWLPNTKVGERERGQSDVKNILTLSAYAGLSGTFSGDPEGLAYMLRGQLLRSNVDFSDTSSSRERYYSAVAGLGYAF